MGKFSVTDRLRVQLNRVKRAARNLRSDHDQDINQTITNIQTLQSQVTTLQNQNEALQSDLLDLTARVTALENL
jgi:phage shock protein A